MEARRQPIVAAEMTEDTIPTWPEPRYESGTRLAVSASEKPTLPPPRDDSDVMVSHIHLGPSVDEVLYRLSLGDLSGASLANEELESYVPQRATPIVVIEAMDLSYIEQYMLAAVDGLATWSELLDASPFKPRDSLQALCDLVDKGVLALTR
jgi:hypothetical protein